MSLYATVGRTVYVVFGSDGEFEDYSEWPVCWHAKKENASRQRARLQKKAPRGTKYFVRAVPNLKGWAEAKRLQAEKEKKHQEYMKQLRERNRKLAMKPLARAPWDLSPPLHPNCKCVSVPAGGSVRVRILPKGKR